jgi:hypothetical protein
MDKQLILRLAREAGISETRLHFDELDDLCDFATLVAEECAKICEDVRVPFARDDGEVLAAEAIRAAFKVTEA